MTDPRPVGAGGDHLRFDKPTRTDMHCHACSKNFIALLDYRLNGNHVAECPHCGHKHYRVIKDGVITGDRWQSDSSSGSDANRTGIQARRVWKVDGDVLEQAGQTMGTKYFLRQRWLEKGT